MSSLAPVRTVRHLRLVEPARHRRHPEASPSWWEQVEVWRSELGPRRVCVAERMAEMDAAAADDAGGLMDLADALFGPCDPS